MLEFCSDLNWQLVPMQLVHKKCTVRLRNDKSKPREGDGGEETRSGTEKRCSHNLQSGHPALRSADNCSIFPTVNDLDFLEARSEPAEEIRNT